MSMYPQELASIPEELVAAGAEQLLLDELLRLCTQRGWRHSLGANNAAMRPMCWQQPTPEAMWNVWGRRCAQPSMRSRLWPPTGSCSRLRATGSSATGAGGQLSLVPREE